MQSEKGKNNEKQWTGTMQALFVRVTAHGHGANKHLICSMPVGGKTVYESDNKRKKIETRVCALLHTGTDWLKNLQ